MYMSDAVQSVREKLFSAADEKYRLFQIKLIPNVPGDRIIGVRTPTLRKIAAEIAGTPEAREFMRVLPHEYYEENGIHSFFIEKIKDYDAAVEAIDAFLPYVDNWATCDSMSPKVLGRHKPELLEKIKEWTASGKTYTVRFGIEMLMSYFLDGDFFTGANDLVSGVVSDEYYVNMMKAWYFATALAKQYESTVPYIEEYKLDKWTHNKTIQKATESYRITDERKSYLRSLKK